MRLFDRTTRRTELTAAGRSFVKKARNVLSELEMSLVGIRDFSRRLTGTITIACVPSAVSFFLPGAIEQYHRQFPGIRVRVIDEASSVVLLAVARGEADFGLTYVGADEPDLEFTPILRDPFVLACLRTHPFASRRSVTWSDFAGRDDYITIAQGSGNRALIDDALAKNGDAPASFCEVRHVPALVSMIEAGLGIGIVPRLALPPGPHPVIVSVPIGEADAGRDLGAIRRKGKVLTVAAQHFWDLVVSDAATPY